MELFGPMSQRFVQALRRALPERSPIDLALGYQFLVAVMVYVISGQIESSTIAATHPEGVDDERLLERMIEFAAAGLRAPPSA